MKQTRSIHLEFLLSFHPVLRRTAVFFSSKLFHEILQITVSVSHTKRFPHLIDSVCLSRETQWTLDVKLKPKSCSNATWNKRTIKSWKIITKLGPHTGMLLKCLNTLQFSVQRLDASPQLNEQSNLLCCDSPLPLPDPQSSPCLQYLPNQSPSQRGPWASAEQREISPQIEVHLKKSIRSSPQWLPSDTAHSLCVSQAPKWSQPLSYVSV